MATIQWVASLTAAGAILISMVIVTNAQLVFREEPRDTTIVKGQPVIFHCITEDSSNTGQSNIVTEWRQNGAPIQQGGRVTVFINGTLHMASSRDGDEGSYSCFVSLVTGSGVVEQQESVAATLYFAFLDPVYLSPSSQSAIDKQLDTIWFQCISGDSRPPSTITWVKDDVQVTEMDGTFYETSFGGADSLMTSGTLQINDVGTRHAGRYQCLVHNPLLPDQVERSQNFTLTVNPNPGAPYINTAPSSQIIPVGQSATFPCSILGDPEPQLTWQRAGENGIIVNRTNRMVLPNGALYFTDVQDSDEGLYVCTGSSRLGSVSSQPASLITASMDWTFTQHPSDVEIVQNSPVTLTCRPPYSKPIANVTWYKNNQEYMPRSGAAILDVGDLYFSAIVKEDEGEYFCIASNDYIPQSVTSDSATLIVRVGAMITDPLVHTEVTLGGDLTLTCLVTGDPYPSIYWYKDNSLISPGNRVTIGDNNQLLHIINVIGLDQGTYKCAARNNYGFQEVSEYVDVLIPPQITTGPGNINAGIGSSVFLPCQYIGDPVPTVTWYKEQTLLDLTPGGTKYQKTNQGLHVNKLVLGDSSNYKCVAENKVGSAESSGRLTVEIEPIMHGPPNNKTVNQGVVVVFTCDANGIPAPTLQWQFNGGPIPAWASVSNSGQVLTISSASQGTMGRYTCVATNSQGSVMADAFLKVKVIPIIQPIEDLTLQSGQQLVAPCVASGTPAPSFQWLKGQDVVIATNRISFPAAHILVVNDLLNDDQGDYSCVATNSVGSTRETFHLSVLDLPGQPSILEAIPVSATSIRITWVAGGDTADSTHFLLQYRQSRNPTWVTYADNIEVSTQELRQEYIAHGLQENQEYQFQIFAVNAKGSSPPSDSVLAATPSVTGPSNPRNLHIVSVNATAVVLEWEIPATRSGPIDVYVVEYFEKNTNDYASLDVQANEQYTIDVTVTGLEPVTLYLFRVCAATLYQGQRQWGNYTNYIQQLTLPGPPSAAPESVSVEASSSGRQLQVNWMQVPPDDLNGILLGYDVYYREVDSTTSWQVIKGNSSEALSAIIPDLKPWTEYEVKVRAYNVEGDGPFSLLVTGTTLAEAPSGSPVDVVVTVVNQTAITVSWEAVPVEQRLGPIDGYTISYQADEDGLAVQYTVDITSANMEVTLTSLLVATTYMIQVSAYNNVTNSNLVGPTSSVQYATTHDGMPGPINSLMITEGPGYLFLQWQPPVSPNGEILAYVIEYRADPIDAETEVMVTIDTVTPAKARRRRAVANATYGRIESTETSYNLTGIQPAMRFWIGVAAKTRGGVSVDVIGKYAFTDPASPTKPTVFPDPGQFTTEEGAVRPPNNAFALPYPLSSIIIFVSAVALAGLALILAMVVMVVWCKGRENRHANKRANLLLPNEMMGSQAGSSRPPSEDFVMDNTGKMPSLMEATRLSTSINTIAPDEYSSDLSQMENGPLDPSRPRALSSPPINHLIMQQGGANNDPVVYAESGGTSNGARPVSRGSRGGVQGRLYTQAKSPRHSRYHQVNLPNNNGAEGSDTSPERLEDLYSQVTRSNRGGPNRMKKDSLAAIASLLDDEEEGSLRSADSSSVVIANQRTTL